jgi:hypothetical protein
VIAAALFAFALTTAPAPAGAVPWCRGVAIDTQEGRANFVWLTAEGSEQDLQRLKSAAETMRLFHVIGPHTGARGGTEVAVYFQTMHGRPEETTNPADALAFLERAERGEFGNLTIRPLIMDIGTLPADRC